jgi:ligand-binding sensor domain-containing protein/signal transduction histidine kinase
MRNSSRSFWLLWAGLLIVTGFTAFCADHASDVRLGQPVVARNADGRMEVFKVDADGELRHRWQKEPNGEWSAWASLGGTYLPGLAAVTLQSGAIEVFAVDRATGSLNFSRQSGPHEWSAWQSLGGKATPPAAVVQDTNGLLRVFVRTEQAAVRYISQTNISGDWSEWKDLDGQLLPGLVVMKKKDGSLELFGVCATNNHLLHRWEEPNGGQGWSGWADMGGPVFPGFTVARELDGNFELFAVCLTNDMVSRRRQFALPDGFHWAPWENFGMKARPGLATAMNADGRIELFGINPRSTVVHRWQIKANVDAWSGWAELDGQGRPTPALQANLDGNLEIFAMDAAIEGTVNHRRQINGNNDWLYWQNMDRPPLEYTPRAWQTDEGLPHNRVQAIAQTQDGYLWVGTFEGLARFDGLEFTTYNCATTPQLKSASITSLCVDRDGIMWIGTEAGLVKMERGIFSGVTKQDGLVGDAIRGIMQGRDGSIWIGTTNGVSRFHEGKFQNFTAGNGLLSNEANAIREDPDGVIWIATRGGLNHFSKGKMEASNPRDGLPAMSIDSLCMERGHRIWVGSDRGMTWYCPGKCYTYTTLHGLSDNFISVIFEDSQTNLWVGTYSGLNRFMGGRFRAEVNNHGMPYDHVNTLFEDSRGDVWVGSNEGLIRLTVRPFSVETKRQKLSHNHVTSVLEDHLGRLWLGTWGGGLDQITEDGVRVFATTNRFASDLVLGLCEAHDGSVWVGADMGGGLTRMGGDAVEHFTSHDGLISGGIRALHEDQSGLLWIGTSQGLCCKENGRFVAKTNWEDKAVRTICEDPAGVVWFGGDGGLDRWFEGHFEKVGGEPVSALYADERSNLWIGTLTAGLVRQHQGHAARFTTTNGLFSNEILGIIEDRGWLWMASTKGIFRVRRHDLEMRDDIRAADLACVTYGKGDGLESVVCSSMASPTIWKTGDGRLCFATTKGLAVMADASAATASQAAPKVYVEQFEVDRKRVALAGEADLHVPPNRGELEFHYTALDLRAPEKCRFKYKLAGVDRDWVNAGNHRVAHYNDVGPGSYVFTVQACNKDGVWNDTGATLSIVIQPHAWETWWFRALAFLIVTGTSAGIARYVLAQKVRQKLALIEMQHSLERDRARISRDIHDDMGATLTQITLLSELAQRDAHDPPKVNLYTGQISQTARELVQAMDEIVWAINPRNDSLPMLAGYIIQHAESFFSGTGLLCRFDTPDELPEERLSAETRHHLFLAAKEALNNAARHSGATEVWLRLRLVNGELQFRVEDNGVGFTLDSRRKFGNGLANMRRRMEEIGGVFEIQSVPGRGTTICLRFPLSTPVKH